jgi:hypothetical protein
MQTEGMPYMRLASICFDLLGFHRDDGAIQEVVSPIPQVYCRLR